MNGFLPLYQPLPTPSEIRRWDELSSGTFGIPSLLLMENASREALRVLQKYVALNANTRVLVFIGRGNNGGDGIALARHLHDLGCRVLVYHTVPLDEITGIAKEHLNIAQRTGVNFLEASKSSTVFLPGEWHAPDAVVDAIIGNGLKGELRNTEIDLIRAINQVSPSSFILSLDVPTGLSGETGRPMPEAVRAHATVAFEAATPGLYFPDSSEFVGDLHVCPIGMPTAARDLLPASWRLLHPDPGASFAPSPRLHKGEAGRVLVIGGSRGMTGAPVLATQGALRTGAGLIYLACPAGLEREIQNNWAEVITVPVGDSDQWTEEAANELLAAIAKLGPDCLVIGPGLGRSSDARAMVGRVLSMEERCPAVIDADALSFFRFGQSSVDPKDAKSPFLDPDLLQPFDILTPHPGEMARLLPDRFFSDVSPAPTREGSMFHLCVEVLQNDRPQAILAFTKACQSVCILKGAGTLIGQQDNPSTIFPLETAALATAGSGDVLSGTVAALVAQGLSSLDAACFGTYLHGCAGLKLQEKAPRGHRASEIADMIPLVWEELQAPVSHT